MAGEVSGGIGGSVTSLITFAAGTGISLATTTQKHKAFVQASRRKLTELSRQRIEEQRLAGERAELRMAQYATNVGAAATMAGSGAGISSVGSIQASYGFGTAMEAHSDANAVASRLRAINADMQAVRDSVEAERKQLAIDFWTTMTSFGQGAAKNIANVQGAVQAKRLTQADVVRPSSVQINTANYSLVEPFESDTKLSPQPTGF